MAAILNYDYTNDDLIAFVRLGFAFKKDNNNTV